MTSTSAGKKRRGGGEGGIDKLTHSVSITSRPCRKGFRSSAVHTFFTVVLQIKGRRATQGRELLNEIIESR